MDLHNDDLARDLQDGLGLASPPIAGTMLDEAPRDVPRLTRRVAAGCAFWEIAAKRTFLTVASDHELCAVGSYTANLSGSSNAVESELARSLEVMQGLDYVREEEVASIPVMNKESKYLAYGPLAGFPFSPDIVLLFAHARQSLTIAEAVQRVDSSVPPAMGRPACAAIPQAYNTGRAVLSLGCCGARTYLDTFTDRIGLWVLPGLRIDAYARTIRSFAQANNTLARFHAQRRCDVEAGLAPSVDESLAHLE